MLATVYLLIASLAGFAVVTRALPNAPTIIRVPAGFLIAVVFTSWTTYLVASNLNGHVGHPLRTGLIVSTVASLVILVAFGRSLRLRDLRLPLVDAGVSVFALVLSWWVVHAHLRDREGELMVSANTWADMGLHIALSRSFSAGANYPAQYPFFAGEPIRYHFGFDFFAGSLQEGGASVLTSFNLPATIGFAAMMLAIFAISRLLFSPKTPVKAWRDRGVWAGLGAVLFLMTNQSFAWERYVQADAGGNILKALEPSVWWRHEGYDTIGPYSDDRIAIFNTLNAFLTQSHLIVATGVILVLAYVVLGQLLEGDRPRRGILLGVGATFGAAFWLNGVVWLAAAVFLGALLSIWTLSATWQARKAQRAALATDAEAATPEGTTADHTEIETGADDRDASPVVGPRRTFLQWLALGACFAVPALALGIPQAIMLNGGGTEGGVALNIGYLVCSSEHAGCATHQMDLLSLHDWGAFLMFWWLNDGFFAVLLVVAFVIGGKRDRKIIAAVMAIFVWGSLVRVGVDVGGQNHKVFNLWEALAGPFVAYVLVRIWVAAGRLKPRGNAMTQVSEVIRFGTIAIGFMMIVSGLVDFMTIKNDPLYEVFGDEPTRDVTAWIAKETPPRAIFLTDYDQLYTAPTMAGRGIMLGFSSWASSAGYDVEPRQKAISAIYSAPDQATACGLLKANRVDYVVLGPYERSSTRFKVNEAAFSAMVPAKVSGQDGAATRVFRVADNC